MGSSGRTSLSYTTEPSGPQTLARVSANRFDPPAAEVFEAFGSVFDPFFPSRDPPVGPPTKHISQSIAHIVRCGAFATPDPLGCVATTPGGRTSFGFGFFTGFGFGRFGEDASASSVGSLSIANSGTGYSMSTICAGVRR